MPQIRFGQIGLGVLDEGQQIGRVHHHGDPHGGLSAVDASFHLLPPAGKGLLILRDCADAHAAVLIPEPHEAAVGEGMAHDHGGEGGGPDVQVKERLGNRADLLHVRLGTHQDIPPIWGPCSSWYRSAGSSIISSSRLSVPW